MTAYPCTSSSHTQVGRRYQILPCIGNIFLMLKSSLAFIFLSYSLYMIFAANMNCSECSHKKAYKVVLFLQKIVLQWSPQLSNVQSKEPLLKPINSALMCCAFAPNCHFSIFIERSLQPLITHISCRL